MIIINSATSYRLYKHIDWLKPVHDNVRSNAITPIHLTDVDKRIFPAFRTTIETLLLY